MKRSRSKGRKMAFKPARKQVKAVARSISRNVPVPSARQLVRNPRDMGYLDYTTYIASPLEFNSTGAVILPFPVAMGSGASNRVGRTILLRGINFRGQVMAKTATSTDKPVFLVVYDNRPTDSLPTITQILESSHPSAQNNAENSSRFRIIRRFVWNIDGTSAGDTADSSHLFEEYVDLKGKKTEYATASGGTGAIGDIQKGALYFVASGFRGTGTSATEIYFTARLQFVDV